MALPEGCAANNYNRLSKNVIMIKLRLANTKPGWQRARRINAQSVSKAKKAAGLAMSHIQCPRLVARSPHKAVSGAAS